MTAAIDGSEEVWSAILASILTHIAVFVPLLFLDGRLEHPVPAAVGGRGLLAAMSLFVAVTLVPVLCSRLLMLPPPPERAQRHQRHAVHGSANASSTAWTRATASCCTWRSRTGRPCVARRRRLGRRRGRSSAARCRSNWRPQADEGQVTVNVGAAARHAHRSAPTPVLQRVEAAIKQLVPEATDVITSGGGGGGFGPAAAATSTAASSQILLMPAGRAHALERSDRAGPAAPAVGHPRRHRPRATRRAATSR